MTPPATLSIGDLARRTGLTVTAIRFYEQRGLVTATRGSGNQRRFARADIRRLSFALIAQKLGLTITEIEAELKTLPQNHAPTAKDWQTIATRIQSRIAAQITFLQNTQTRLTGCIGCGCLSLKSCALYNPNDQIAQTGSGPRFLLQNPPSNVPKGQPF